MSFQAHPKALCESSKIGEGTRVSAFAHILSGATIGSVCDIGQNVLIEGGKVVGDGVTVKGGVQLWDGLPLEDGVFIGPNVTFTNVRFPRSRDYPAALEKTLVCAGASIGAHATILPGR